MATFFNLAPRKGFVWKQSFINRTTRGATEGKLRVYSEGALKKNLLVQGYILHQA